MKSDRIFRNRHDHARFPRRLSLRYPQETFFLAWREARNTLHATLMRRFLHPGMYTQGGELQVADLLEISVHWIE